MINMYFRIQVFNTWKRGEIDIINYKSFFINYISPRAGAQIDRLVLRNGDELYTILELKY